MHVCKWVRNNHGMGGSSLLLAPIRQEGSFLLEPRKQAPPRLAPRRAIGLLAHCVHKWTGRRARPMVGLAHAADDVQARSSWKEGTSI